MYSALSNTYCTLASASQQQNIYLGGLAYKVGTHWEVMTHRRDLETLQSN